MRLPDFQKLERLFFRLSLLFLPTQLGKHFWPDFAFIYSLRIDYLSPTIYLWDLIVFGLILFWLLGKPKVNTTTVSLLLLLFLTQAVSLFWSANIGGGLTRLYQYLAPALLAVYITNQKKETIFKEITTFLSVGLLGSGLIAVGQFLTSGTLGLWILGERSFNLTTPSIATFNWVGQVFLRPYATFSHPNVLAGFIVVCLYLLFVATENGLTENPITKKRFFLLLTVLLSLLAAMLTFSRVAIIVLFVELLCFLQKQKRLLFLVVFLATPFLYVRFLSTFNFDLLSVIRREELALTAITFFKSNWLTGIGLNNFINQMASSSLISGSSRFLQPVHNIFLLTLSETGIIGLVGFLLFLGYPFYKLLKQYHRKRPLFILGVIIFLGTFDHYLLTVPQGQRLFFLVWGITMLEYYSGDSKKSS